MAFIAIAARGSDTESLQLAGKELIHYPPRCPGHPRPPVRLRRGGHLGFYGFLRVANAHISGRVMVGLPDLPDRLWRDAYDNGAHPGDTANLFSHSYRFAQ
ncbi:hypothetical protein [Roseomonas mucosa]|uniref:hypothetical protein n=1 Tax=Roseomonas mucosa TaxID=207340 RepID=UPI002B40E642|nr:hypothetical protein [Roseomonas mucosa]QDD97427.1 Hypothetical protein ADP8_03907c [Roseomonas mucosa]